VEYIANYIELQRLRLPEEVKAIMETDLGDNDVFIEPLLLLPFVENAFKHGVDVEKGGTIKVRIKLSETELTLHVSNPIVDQGGSIKEHTGIGVENTLKRLKLLYNDKFKLSAGAVQNEYVVDLLLKLNENEVSDS
jgi:sensor histidine kinase YesM